MKINIDRLTREGLEISRDFKFAGEDIVEENTEFLEPVHAEVKVSRAGEEVNIKGRIWTSLQVICSRCLETCELPVDSIFDLVYLPGELNIEKEQLGSDDIEKLYYHSREFELADVVLEQLNLAFPVRPLCSEDCRGICPVCGKTLNYGDCSCETDGADARLDNLKNFMRDKR